MLTVVDQSPRNFISDLFFLVNAFQHLGLIKTIGSRVKAEKNISDFEKELKRAEASRADWAGVSHGSLLSLTVESGVGTARGSRYQEV